MMMNFHIFLFESDINLKKMERWISKKKKRKKERKWKNIYAAFFLQAGCCNRSISVTLYKFSCVVTVYLSDKCKYKYFRYLLPYSSKFFIKLCLFDFPNISLFFNYIFFCTYHDPLIISSNFCLFHFSNMSLFS